MRHPWCTTRNERVRPELDRAGPGVDERPRQMRWTRVSDVGDGGILLLWLAATATMTAGALAAALSTLLAAAQTTAGGRTWGGVGSSYEGGWR